MLPVLPRCYQCCGNKKNSSGRRLGSILYSVTSVTSKKYKVARESVFFISPRFFAFLRFFYFYRLSKNRGNTGNSGNNV